MNVITTNPIMEDMSNCCGNSSADGMPSAGRCGNPNCPYARKGMPCPYRMKGRKCGFGRRRRARQMNMVKNDLSGRPVIVQSKSSFDDYSYADELALPTKPLTTIPTGLTPDIVQAAQAPLTPATPKGSASPTIGSMTKEYLAQQKAARKEDRLKATSDILLGAGSRAEARRGAREARRGERLTQREARQSERMENRKARAARRSDRKAKRNAKKLELIKTPRSTEPKFFFPLQKLRLSKRKKGNYTKVFPDGQETELTQAQVVVTPQGEAYDAVEISKATNIPVQNVQGKTLTQQGIQDPVTRTNYEFTTTKDPSTGQSTLAVEANDNNVSGASDGGAYLKFDVQGVNEPPQDVKKDDDKKAADGAGMTTTQKIVLGVGAAVVVGLVIYAIVKGRKGTAASAASAGNVTLSKVA